jgi:hypothetical protein
VRALGMAGSRLSTSFDPCRVIKRDPIAGGDPSGVDSDHAPEAAGLALTAGSRPHESQGFPSSFRVTITLHRALKTLWRAVLRRCL